MLELGISTTLYDLEFNSSTRANLKLSHLEETRRMTHNLPSYQPHHSLKFFFFGFVCQFRFHPLPVPVFFYFYTRIKSSPTISTKLANPLHRPYLSLLLPPPHQHPTSSSLAQPSQPVPPSSPTQPSPPSYPRP